MADRIDDLEHDGPRKAPKLKRAKPKAAVAEDRNRPYGSAFGDARGCVFRTWEGEEADDEDVPEPKGFDPIKSRYGEGLRD